jgi:hypothetical protein
MILLAFPLSVTFVKILRNHGDNVHFKGYRV